MKDSETIGKLRSQFPAVLVYDQVLMRPACVLLQAVFGGTGHLASAFFNSDDWLLDPTPNMKPYTVKSREEMDKIVALTVAHPGREKRLTAWP